MAGLSVAPTAELLVELRVVHLVCSRVALWG